MTPGRTIANRFIIEDPVRDLLGRGGMGEVYRAIDTHTGDTVAVKALNPEIVLRNPDLLKRFQREGEALRQLNHPNIVRFIDALEEAGLHYLVIEYVPGGSLEGLLAKEGCIPYAQVVEIALDLADALTRAHRLGILHRDLKPANVLLAEDGTPRLADFGIAYQSETPRLTQTGILVGTVDYLSPEVCQGEPPDECSDIWSFGILLFEMLSGRLPFEGDNLTAKLISILTQSVPDIAKYSPNIPDALADLIYRMLEKDPQQRIPSMRLVGAELEAVTKGWEGFYSHRKLSKIGLFTNPITAFDGARHNLPSRTTPFVGRETELLELTHMLDDPDIRLVTITGLGGMGKTSIAIEACKSVIDRFIDGIFFTSLAPINSIKSAILAISKSVNLVLKPEIDPKLQLLEFLRHRQLLLTLDNFEHLLATETDEARNLIIDVLQIALGIKILITSRVNLNLQAEHVYFLTGFDTLKIDERDAVESSAVKLFLQNVQRIWPGFTSDHLALRKIIDICRLVGGMPLGIILAASWIRYLTLDEITEEIQKSLDLLDTDQMDIPQRQHSLRTVFEQSWILLGERERIILRRLSIFRGGFTREAAQQVTGASLRELMMIINQSLLQREPFGRYDLHELVRQYAAEKLELSDEAHTIRQHHLEYYLSLAKQYPTQPNASSLSSWLRSMDSEHDNLLAALDWSMVSHNFNIGLKLASYTRYYWFFFTYQNEGRFWLQQLLNADKEPSIERARGLEAFAHLTSCQDSVTAAIEAARESLALAEKLGDLQVIADASYRLAWASLGHESTSVIRPLLERSLELYKKLDQQFWVASVYNILGETARIDGNQVLAREMHQYCYHISQQFGRKSPYISTDLAMVMIHFGDLERCRELLQESFNIILETGNLNSDATAVSLMASAFLAISRKQPVLAAQLLGVMDRINCVTGNGISPSDLPDYEQSLATLRRQLGNEAFETARAAGQQLMLEQAIDLALKED